MRDVQTVKPSSRKSKQRLIYSSIQAAVGTLTFQDWAGAVLLVASRAVESMPVRTISLSISDTTLGDSPKLHQGPVILPDTRINADRTLQRLGTGLMKSSTHPTSAAVHPTMLIDRYPVKPCWAVSACSASLFIRTTFSSAFLRVILSASMLHPAPVSR